MSTLHHEDLLLTIFEEVQEAFPYLDEDQQIELKEYFMDSDNDNIEEAMQEFEGDYEDFELRIYRIKFLSEFAN